MRENIFVPAEIVVHPGATSYVFLRARIWPK